MGTHIKVKYVQPIESMLIKLTDGSDMHWFTSKVLTSEPIDVSIEWIDGKPYRVSYL